MHWCKRKVNHLKNPGDTKSYHQSAEPVELWRLGAHSSWRLLIVEPVEITNAQEWGTSAQLIEITRVEEWAVPKVISGTSEVPIEMMGTSVEPKENPSSELGILQVKSPKRWYKWSAHRDYNISVQPTEITSVEKWGIRVQRPKSSLVQVKHPLRLRLQV